MICVECTNPEITCLFSEYKSKYVQLTVCPRCGKFADPYIEFDNVILFLDLMLLRPQAYRHVAYNMVEEAIFKQESRTNSFEKYRKLIRFVVLSVLFEVYLKWAYEEKSDSHTLLKATVLELPPVWQYVFFVCLQLAEKALFFTLILALFIKLLGWGKVKNVNLSPSSHTLYYICVLILTLLMSLAVRCLPILMLIWPYDNAAVASIVVDVLGVFNTIEALRIITGCSYLSTTFVIAVSAFFLIGGKQLGACYAVSLLNPNVTWKEFFHDENKAFVGEIQSLTSAIMSALQFDFPKLESLFS